MATSNEQNRPGWSISLHWVTVISLLYLALPCMLFFSSWFTPWVAWPVNLGIAVSICCVAIRPIQGSSLILNKWNVAGLLFSAAICVLLFLSVGIAGYVAPARDVLIFREALYNNLIHASWPLVLPNGSEMSYYLAGMLPPAMLARLTDDYTMQRLIAVLWYALGIWLTLLVFYVRYRRVSLLFLVFLLYFKDPFYFINCFAGSGEVWTFISKYITIPFSNTYEGVEHPVKMLMTNAQGCNFHPFTLLTTSLILSCRARAELLIPLIIALIIPSSPLGALGCMVLALPVWWKFSSATLTRRAACLIAPILIATCCAAYYLRAESATCLGLHGTLMQNWFYFFCNYYAGIFLSTILFAWILRKHLRTEPLLYLSLAGCLIIPWFYFGSSPDSEMFGMNELWLKTCVIFHTHILSVLCFEWKKLPRLKYIYILSVAVLAAKEQQHERLTTLTGPEVDDAWAGHLNHIHPSLYQKIPYCHATAIPKLLLQNGESEQIFPGNCLPKAKGCDYSPAPSLEKLDPRY